MGFVEVGRIAVLGGAGPNQGKIAAVVNVIDQNRVLIDGPTSGVLRQAYPIKQLQLTPISVKFPFNAPSRIVRKELEANKVDETWANSTKAKRASLTDLDRFKLRKAKSARNKILAKALNGKKKTEEGWEAVKLVSSYPCNVLITLAEFEPE